MDNIQIFNVIPEELIFKPNDTKYSNNFVEIKINDDRNNTNKLILRDNNLCYIDILDSNGESFNYNKELCIITNIEDQKDSFNIEYKTVIKIIRRNDEYFVLCTSNNKDITLNQTLNITYVDFDSKFEYCKSLTKVNIEQAIKFKRIVIKDSYFMENETGIYYNFLNKPKVTNFELPTWCKINIHG